MMLSELFKKEEKKPIIEKIKCSAEDYISFINFKELDELFNEHRYFSNISIDSEIFIDSKKSKDISYLTYCVSIYGENSSSKELLKRYVIGEIESLTTDIEVLCSEDDERYKTLILINKRIIAIAKQNKFVKYDLKFNLDCKILNNR